MNPEISDTHSRALKIATFLATLLVVLRHAQNLHRFYPDGSVWMPVTDCNIFMQRFISEFTAVAIPCFFCISGFLFFAGLRDFKPLAAKLQRRIRSLLIPYWLWNALFLLFWSLLALVPQFHDQLIRSYGLSQEPLWIIRQLTVDPIVGQFWYIRTLMLFCLLTPLLLWSYRSRLIAVLTLTTLMHYWEIIDCRLWSTEGIFWFYFGGLVGYNGWHKLLTYHRYCWVLPPLIAAMIAADIWGVLPVWRIRIMLTMIFLFQLSLFLTRFPAVSRKLERWGKYSFFIYALHGQVVSVVSIYCSQRFAHTPINSFLSYWLGVCSAIGVSFAAAAVLKKFLPGLYQYFSGGRG